MPALLPLSLASFAAMWLMFFTAIIAFEDGDDKRTLLLIACIILDLLTGFSMLIPTYSTTSVSSYNVVIYNGNSISSTIVFPIINTTNVNPPFSNPVITLYVVFTVFQGFLFFVFAAWSLRYRLQYKTMKQYQDEMDKIRRKRRLA